ncbi:MAG: rhomboid family intramembrane serine protease [Flammeovirgaceae bacterium]|nr:rhomboid family intramembrane serine protease [Flammeovirgaceae bacterium]
MDLIKDLPKVTKVLLIINIAMFILASLYPSINQVLALHYFESSLFSPHQIVSHIFMHSGLTHLFFNMYALVVFGGILEKQLSSKKFTFLYFFSAIGAFSLHMGIIWYEVSNIPADMLNLIQTEGAEIIANGQNYTDDLLGKLNAKYNGAMVGASGAIMGLLAGFAILFPNAKLGIIFIPIPVKAKYFIPIYMIIELFLGVSEFQWDNIAHFAHIGGAVFGFFLLFIWKKNGEINSKSRPVNENRVM